MNRDRTNLYLSYRRTIKRPDAVNKSKFDLMGEEEEGLIESRRGGKGRYKDNDIEMKVLPPSIFDISKDLDGYLKDVKFQTNELSLLYKKLLITNQAEKHKVEKKIEDLNYEITKKFEHMYVLVKKFDFLEKNHEKLKLNYSLNELLVIENFKKTYAMRIQESSLIFRNLQNNYIKFLNDDEEEQESLLGSSNTDQYNLIEDEETSKNIEDYSKRILQKTQGRIQKSQSGYLQAREREISQIAMKILEVSTIFKEMESLVVDQGSVLDRIDFNLANAVQDLRESDKELIKAEGYQKRTTKCKIILLLSLVVFVLLMIVTLRPHSTSTTSKVEVTKPSDNEKQDKPSSDKPNNYSGEKRT